MSQIANHLSQIAKHLRPLASQVLGNTRHTSKFLVNQCVTGTNFSIGNPNPVIGTKRSWFNASIRYFSSVSSAPNNIVRIPIGNGENFPLTVSPHSLGNRGRNENVRIDVLDLAKKQGLYPGKKIDILIGTDVVGLIEACYPNTLTSDPDSLRKLSEFMQILFANDDDSDIPLEDQSSDYISQIKETNKAMIYALDGRNQGDHPSKKVTAIQTFFEENSDFCKNQDLRREFASYLNAVLYEKKLDETIADSGIPLFYVSDSMRKNLEYMRPEASGAVLAQIMAVAKMESNGMIANGYGHYAKKYRGLSFMLNAAGKHIGFFNDVVSFKKERKAGIALLNAVQQTRAMEIYKENPLIDLAQELSTNNGELGAKRAVLTECNQLHKFFLENKEQVRSVMDEEDSSDIELIMSCFEAWFAQPWWVLGLPRYN